MVDASKEFLYHVEIGRFLERSFDCFQIPGNLFAQILLDGTGGTDI